MSQQFIVLDVKGYAQQLVQFSHLFVEQTNRVLEGPMPSSRVAQRKRELLSDTPLTPFDLRRAMTWIKLIVDEIIESRLQYKKPESKTQQYASLLFNISPLLLTTSHLQFTEDFLCENGVDSIFVEVTLQVSEHVEDNSWRQWETFQQGNMVALIAGRDYRIVEWENLTGHSPDEVYDLQINLSNMVNYIQQQIVQAVGPGGLMIDLHPIVTDAIRRKFPRIRFDSNILNLTTGEFAYVFDENPTINYDKLFSLGIQSYEQFYNEFIAKVFDMFANMHMRARLDSETPYHGNLSRDFVFSTRALKPTVKNTPKSELEALAESLARGDYLPPDERKMAEDFLLSGKMH